MSEFTKILVQPTADGVIRIPLEQVHTVSDVFLLSAESHEKISHSEVHGSGTLVLGHSQKGKVSPGQTEILFQDVPPGNWFVYFFKTAITTLPEVNEQNDAPEQRSVRF